MGAHVCVYAHTHTYKQLGRTHSGFIWEEAAQTLSYLLGPEAVWDLKSFFFIKSMILMSSFLEGEGGSGVGGLRA